MPAKLGGAAKRATREAVQLLGGHLKPRGRTPRDCTWDYAVGVWRNADGEERATNQTRVNQAAHRHPRGERSRLKAARLRAKIDKNQSSQKKSGQIVSRPKF